MMKMFYSRHFWRRWLFLFLLLIAVNANAHVSGDTSKITLHVVNQPIESVFKLIEKQSGYTFFYGNSIINGKSRVSIDVDRASLSDVMNTLLKGHNVNWVIKNRGVILSKIEPVPLRSNQLILDTVPSINVSGIITDKKGIPLQGVSIAIKGHTRGQGSDGSGRFAFANIPGNSTLVFSSIGFDTKQIKVAGRTMLQVVLDSTIREIEAVEVVSTGYQKIPKETATGSFVQISNKLFNEQVGTGVIERLPAITSSMNVLPRRLTNNQFAITIRGMSTFGGPQKPLIILDNFPFEGDINTLNPNDVENITVLRDAAAASIWGASAGNGVIVINTKSGKFNSKVQFDFNSTVSVSSTPQLNYLKPISTSDYIDAEKFLFENGYYDGFLDFYPIGFQTPVVDILDKMRKGELTDAEGNSQINKLRSNDIRDEYNKYFYKNAINQQYSLNVSGGSVNNAWNVSASYDQNKNELSSKFKRYTFKIGNIFRPVTNLQVTASVNYSQSQANSGAPGYGSTQRELVLPYQKFIDDNGRPIGSTSYRRGVIDTLGQGLLLDWNYYPTEDYKHKVNSQKTDNLLAKFGVNYTIIPGVSWNVNYQMEKQNANGEDYADAQSYFSRDMINKYSTINYENRSVKYNVPLGGILNQSRSTLNSQNIRSQVNVEKPVGAGVLNGIAGVELREISTLRGSNRLYGYNSELQSTVPVDPINIYSLVHELMGSARIPVDNRMSSTKTKFVSLFTNVLYTYNQKYILSASFRRDASNLFGVESNKKWTPLWSVGAVWNISSESFYNFSALPVLKLRGSYGYSGNVIPTAASATTLLYSSPSIYTGLPRADANNYKNEKLTWEKVKMVNVGIEFASKKNRVSGSVEYFHKRAFDLYTAAPYDRTLGLGVFQIMKNNGAMVGNGVDVILNSRNINGAVFKWYTNLNLSYNVDKVTDFIDEEDEANVFVDGITLAKGRARFPVFSYKFAGLDPLTGNPQGYLNGKISTNYIGLTYDSAKIGDLNYHGAATPKFFGSLGNSFFFHDFSLSVRLSFQFGHYFLRNSINYAELFEQRDGHADFGKRWQKPGDEKFTHVPSMIYPYDFDRENFYAFSEPLISKADNIRIDYINLSYNILKERIKNLPLKNIKLSVIVNNVGLIWAANKYDVDPWYPDDTLPPVTNFSFNLSTNF